MVLISPLSGCDKRPEQRMRMVGAGLEFGVELYTDVELVVGDLDGLDQLAAGRNAGHAQTGPLECITEGAVELVAVAVTFLYFFCRVGVRQDGIG